MGESYFIFVGGYTSKLSRRCRKESTDVNIDIPTRSRYNDYSTVARAKFEIIVPSSGGEELFNISPISFSINVPYGRLYGKELHFIYQIPTGRDKSEVSEDFKRNLKNIKTWLINTKRDVSAFNANVKGHIENLVAVRKKKIDDDKDAANYSGIRIR